MGERKSPLHLNGEPPPSPPWGGGLGCHLSQDSLMTYWISDFSALVLGLVGLVGPVRGLNLRQVGLV